MKVYVGIDLHSNNNVLAVINAAGEKQYCRRWPNDLRAVELALAPYREQVSGIVVESTFNWYWLVDGLMDLGYRLHLANTTAIQQYNGLKHGDDASDARFLAELLRLGILPEGYIYPRAERALRDLARKRIQLVQQRTTNILSVQSSVQRHTGTRVTGGSIKQLEPDSATQLVGVPDVALAIAANLTVRQCLDEQIERLEN